MNNFRRQADHLKEITMNETQAWMWVYSGPKGNHHGFVRAIDPRDALSRALTSDAPDGSLMGEMLGIPVDVLHDAPGNSDSRYAVTADGYTLSVQRVTCPSHARHDSDVAGCGSANVAGPDDEGLFDCECGVFFNPLTCMDAPVGNHV